MRIAFVTNFLSLHQSYFADRLWELTGGNFVFIEIESPNEEIQKKLPSSFNIYDKPYLLQAWRSKNNLAKAVEICNDVDVLLSGGGRNTISFEELRLQRNKLTFEVGERQLKRGIFNAFSATSIAFLSFYRRINDCKNLFYLCCSAFAANDHYLIHPILKGKCYKWAYFTQVPNIDINSIIANRRLHHVKLLWTGRIINWKRVDLAIKLASKLKDLGYDFELNIAGDGDCKRKMEHLVRRLGVGDRVKFLGLLPNEKIYQLMMDHDILVFTSNKREGWGAVLNEAMSNGCACVCSDLIGAAPYLIRPGDNGLLYRTGSLNDLLEKVKFLFDYPDKREHMQHEAYITMSTIWNPSIAAQRFYLLADAKLRGQEIVFDSGPCSLAEPSNVRSSYRCSYE